MIYVDRTKMPVPENLERNLEKWEYDIVLRLESMTKYKQARFSINYENLGLIRSTLFQLFNSKCCYCESSLDKESIIGHFRPLESASEYGSKISHEGYYWLAYKWFNIYLSCLECNRHKGNHFDINGLHLEPPHLALFNNHDKLLKYVNLENPRLIDPCNTKDQNTQHFEFVPNGFLLPITDRAKYTIELLELNRPSLVRLRRLVYQDIQAATSAIHFSSIQSADIEYILKSLNNVSPFLGLKRAIIAKWFFANEKLISEYYPNIKNQFEEKFQESGFNLEDAFGTEKILKSEVDKSVELSPSNIVSEEESSYSKRIKWIEIQNFKSIEHLKIEIPISTHEEEENAVLLIGENGVGKSTVLQAISLAMLGEIELQKLKLGPYKKYIRNKSGAKKALIKVEFENEDAPVVVEIRKDKITSNRKHLVKPVVGIGSIRRLPEDNETSSMNEDPSKIMSLFRHDIVYPDIQEWLSNTKLVRTHQFDSAARTIIDILMLDPSNMEGEKVLRRRSGNLVLNVGNGSESIENMCDGHKSIIGYTLYILRVFYDYWDDAINAEGLIIIDEIGNHLHPSWKFKIVSLFKKVFPRATLIISTHDPICLRAANKGEVWVMNKSIKDKSIQITQKDIPIGTSLESLLIGNWFYMNNTTDRETSKLISDYREEVLSEAPDPNKIKFIKSKLENFGSSNAIGHSNLDIVLDTVRDVKEEIAKSIENDLEYRKKLAERIRNHIKS